MTYTLTRLRVHSHSYVYQYQSSYPYAGYSKQFARIPMAAIHINTVHYKYDFHLYELFLGNPYE